MMKNKERIAMPRLHGQAAKAAGRALGVITLALLPLSGQTVTLADAPLFSTVVVPGNLALALSVEWPTATTPAYPVSVAYSANSEYLGYFDPAKCYQYVLNTTTPSDSYFAPYGSATNHVCGSSASLQLWSGNFLNWVSMQTLDTFRWVLTGGYRSADTTTNTVLTKTYNARDEQNPNKGVSDRALITGGTPLRWSSWNSRVYNLGTAVHFTKNGDLSSTSNIVDYAGQNSYVSAHSANVANESTVYRIYINVKVCDPSVGLEANCVQYGSNYKPEGLMQKYASKLRYSAFGYLNTENTLDGGVMRAKMKYIGPSQPVPGSAPIANGLAEWDSRTGVMLTNPDSGDANTTATAARNSGWDVAIGNSGVMNYLNKFGYGARHYKERDPVGELYYAVTRYFRNQGNVPRYSDISRAGDTNTASRWLDGFPVITNWGDPILYSCQKNFILGIGDVYNWFDGNLPGTTLRVAGNQWWAEDNVPAEVADDRAVDVKAATDMVGVLEGKTGRTLGTSWNDAGRGNTMYIAGLAYAAHTQDIRPDLNGVQSINTYWLDVGENACYEHKNQFWLAAKYGGFTVPSGFLTYGPSNGVNTLAESAWTSSNDILPTSFPGLGYCTTNGLAYSTDSGTRSDKRPDNYFPGNSPLTMKTGLTSAFEKIVSEAASASSTTMASTSDRVASSGNANYAVSYDPNTWTSILKAQLVSYDSTGAASFADVWDATALLDTRTAANRLIVTCCRANGDALPFTADALTNGNPLDSRTNVNSFGAIRGVSSGSQSVSHYLAYLRGDTRYEVANGGPYRTRAHLLGDIVNSKVTAVGAPSGTYYEIYNAGYTSFKSTYRNRPTVVYAGANDGMMHAFDGTVPAAVGGACSSSLTTPSDACGKEVFAYVPSFVYGTSETAATQGLASLGSATSFSHHFMVDATPIAGDVDFYVTPSPVAASNDWRTILVGGLGKGGKGYYAIDITNPVRWTSESDVASDVLWEFTHPHMGYTFGDATIVKTPQYGWTVVVPSGYNNDDGKGYLYFINPRTGELLNTITLPGGGTETPLNLGHVEAYVPDARNGTADSLYAVDLRGNVWRVDLTATVTTSGITKTSNFEYATVQLARLTSPEGGAQPVTTRPLVQPDPSSLKRYVLVGTGQLLSDTDINNTQVQTFYAIIDGTDGYGDFYTAAEPSNPATTRSGIPLPAGISFPVERSVMAANTDLTVGIGSALPSTTPMGWYFDLPRGANRIAERVNVRPDIINGIVAFAGNLPNGDACSPAGTSRIYATGFSDGASTLTNASGARVASSAMTTTAMDISFKSVNGTPRLYTGGGDGTVPNQPGSFGGKTSYKRLNWREVPTAD